MEPRYPDDFDEATQAVTGFDASLPASGLDAGAPLPLDANAPQPMAPALADAGASDATRIDAGRAQPVGVADAAPTTPDASVSRDAGSENDASSETGASVSSCTISASTDASDALFYNGKYGCAVWIGNASGKLVKAFFVATRIANRTGLSAYKTASSGVTVDVVAGATLNAPKQHQYTWNLKDTSGAVVPPGSYTLNVETKSSNGASLVKVPFALLAGPVSETAAPTGEVRSASIKCN